MVSVCGGFKLPSISKTFLRNSFVNAVHKFNHQNKEEKAETETHIYKKVMTRDEVVKFLAKNVVHKEDNVVVTNKPYGLGFQPKVVDKTVANESFCSSIDNSFYLDDILPELAENLGFNSLRVMKAPVRLASGVMILAGSKQAEVNIQKWLDFARTKVMLTDTYLVIALGQPKPQIETQLFLKKEKGSVPVILTESTKSRRKKENIHLYRWKHNVLASSQFGSLLKVELSSTKNSIINNYLGTKCFSPVLGDMILGSKFTKVFGTTFFLNDSSPSGLYQIYDSDLLTALEVSQDDIKIIPNHLHLLSIVLPINKNSNFFASILPPESFNWTCQRLQLPLDKSTLYK